eukprot:CAMPEP_0114286932 /NCGR_PEP_ID=MMETSP0059-20121206/6012_1 /TAXON_ID=36894 /ORGANISM="Pyramimonas parkeae, Strain CCMP726" /LENGTH=140 /DNA_ID=CAMNT_0001407987 /DNA_START=284 /DNA_END=702 /DNA_ORIENTATION=-
MPKFLTRGTSPWIRTCAAAAAVEVRDVRALWAGDEPSPRTGGASSASADTLIDPDFADSASAAGDRHLTPTPGTQGGGRAFALWHRHTSALQARTHAAAGPSGRTQHLYPPPRHRTWGWIESHTMRAPPPGPCPEALCGA